MTAIRRALALTATMFAMSVVAPPALADPALPSADPFYSYPAPALNAARRPQDAGPAPLPPALIRQ